MLARAPTLTPMQVREALRETANQADAPDNDYGWGILDALAAVPYWGPVVDHAPLGDTEDTVGPYVVTATITDRLAAGPGAAAASSTGWTAAPGSSWPSRPRAATSTPPASRARRRAPQVEYYLEADDVQDIVTRVPAGAPAAVIAFAVGPDTTPPVVVHEPLGDQALGLWPPLVTATVTDNLGVAAVDLTFSVDGGAVQGPFALVAGADDAYSLLFPLDAGDLVVGDVVMYTLIAADSSAAGNVTVSGPHAFQVVESLGLVVVIDDGGGGTAAPPKPGADAPPPTLRVGNRGAADTVAGWLGDAGYSVTLVSAETASPADLDGRDAVVLIASDNTNPVASAGLRALLVDWVAAGGRLLVEGGEIGYAAVEYPGYADLAADVLHVVDWAGDGAGSLRAVPGQGAHRLIHQPLEVDPPAELAYLWYGDQDAMIPAGDAFLVLENAGQPGTAGALVFDDTPAEQACQVVYYPFALEALTDQDQARALAVNAVAYLLALEAPVAVPDDPEAPGAAPRATRLAGNAPNPFNPRTTLHLELARADRARLEVYDLRGRLVRRLLDGSGELPAGRHEVVWDGRDAGGRAVGSGTYFARLAAGGVVRHLKMLLVR